ncbi:MAG: hypothetical protein GY869_29350, partial [Planctomycetes bacterium]|nr:hypothetical protein [Planctomycetota bacterium]
YDFISPVLKIEVNHGPIIIDNNILIGSQIAQWGDAGVFIHNLLVNVTFHYKNDSRQVPYYQPHSTVEAGRAITPNHYDKFINNIFIGNGLDGVSGTATGTVMDYNVFLGGAQKNSVQDGASIVDAANPNFQLTEDSDSVVIDFELPASLFSATYDMITYDLIGEFPVPQLMMENPDGSYLNITSDYYNQPIIYPDVLPGPF